MVGPDPFCGMNFPRHVLQRVNKRGGRSEEILTLEVYGMTEAGEDTIG